MIFNSANTDLNGKYCLVTGGASGMGKAFVETLASAGARVLIADKDKFRSEELVSQLADTNKNVNSFCFDAASTDSVSSLSSYLENDIPDILINSLGIGAKPNDDENVYDLWQRIIEINLYGIYHCCAAIGELMIKKGKGNIINVASMSASIIPEKTRAGRMGEYGLLAYCSSKAAVKHLTRGIATLWADYGIRANSISPGYVDTPLTKEPHSDPEIRKKLESKIPLHKIASPEDISGAVLFLASDASSYITGQDIIIDGGYTSW